MTAPSSPDGSRQSTTSPVAPIPQTLISIEAIKSVYAKVAARACDKLATEGNVSPQLFFGAVPAGKTDHIAMLGFDAMAMLKIHSDQITPRSSTTRSCPR